MKKYKVHIIWVIVAIIALIGGFFWGKGSAGSSRVALGGAGAYASSTRRFGGGAGTTGGGLAIGQIASVGSDSFTLQLANGNSEVVFYSTSTPVTEPTIVSPDALNVGTNVMVVGTANSDGSVTAQSIQVRTAAAGPGYGGNGGGSSTSGQY